MRRLLILHFIFSISIILFSFVSAYSEEEINAYEYAFDKGITTAVDINKATITSERNVSVNIGATVKLTNTKITNIVFYFILITALVLTGINLWISSFIS